MAGGEPVGMLRLCSWSMSTGCLAWYMWVHHTSTWWLILMHLTWRQTHSHTAACYTTSIGLHSLYCCVLVIYNQAQVETVLMTITRNIVPLIKKDTNEEVSVDSIRIECLGSMLCSIHVIRMSARFSRTPASIAEFQQFRAFSGLHWPWPWSKR